MMKQPFLDVRKAEYLASDGYIDCEINHPQYGWIPTTLSRDESPDFFDHVVKTAKPGAYTPPPPPITTDAEIDAEIVRRIALTWQAKDQIDALAKQANAQSRMDTFLGILIGGKAITAAQKTEKTAIETKRKETEQLRAKGAALKALSPTKRKGLDITADEHWGTATASTA